MKNKLLDLNKLRSKSKDWDKYKGSIMMTVDNMVYVTKEGNEVPKIIKEIEKKHQKKPLITVVPKEDTLILPLL